MEKPATRLAQHERTAQSLDRKLLVVALAERVADHAP
jgi:hypothetical protein